MVREANHFWLPWRRSPANLIEWKSGKIKKGVCVAGDNTVHDPEPLENRGKEKLSASDSWMIRKFRRQLKMNYSTPFSTTYLKRIVEESFRLTLLSS